MYLRNVFGGEEGTSGYELAASVGVGGEQPGSSTKAWRLLVAGQPCGAQISLGGEERR
jgi:hypothetical protein